MWMHLTALPATSEELTQLNRLTKRRAPMEFLAVRGAQAPHAHAGSAPDFKKSQHDHDDFADDFATPYS